jgi:oxygen-dependent protoporphyrinogen oxidase
VRTAVIGAGIAGLTCAHLLRRGGLDVDVYERESTVGGRMGTRRKGALAFDFGANFLIAAYHSLLELGRELGVEFRNASPVRQVVYRDGRFYRLRVQSISDLLTMRGLHFWSRLELLAYVGRLRHRYPELDFFDLSSVPTELNHEDAYTYARREIGWEFADYVVDPFNSCMFFSRATDSSAAAMVALLSMMTNPSYDFSVMHAVQGMQALPDALASGLSLRTNCPVTGVERVQDGWKITAAGQSQIYQYLVLATPAGAARALLSSGPAAHRLLVENVRYASTVNLSYRIPRTALGRTHCFYVPYLESQLISEFTNESLKDQAGGWSLVNVGLHDSAARGLWSLSDDAIFARVKLELARIEPAMKEAQPYDLARWAEAVPRYDCEHLERVRAFQRSGQGQESVYLCGDYLNAPWLEGACRSGRGVAESILASSAVVAEAPH